MPDQWKVGGKSVASDPNVDSTSPSQSPSPSSSPDMGWKVGGQPIYTKGGGSLPQGVGQAVLNTFPALGGAVGSLFAPESLIYAPLMAGAGGALGETAREAFTPGEPMSLSNIAKEGGTQALNEFGGRLIGKGVEWVANKLSPSKLYQSALGPRTSLKEGERQSVINTGIREGIPVDQGGLQTVQNRVDAIAKDVMGGLRQRSDQLGPVIQPGNVAKEANKIKTQGGWGMGEGPGYSQQVNPDADVSAINGVRNQFIRNHQIEAPFTKIEPNQDTFGQAVTARLTGEKPPTRDFFDPTGTGVKKYAQPMTLEEAQAEKQGTYRALRSRYQARQQVSGSLPEASEGGEMALARGIRQNIEHYFPEIAGKNAREGDLINLEMELHRFLGREGNKKLVGLIPSVVGGSMGAFEGGREHGLEGAGTGALIGAGTVLALNNPAIVSRLAIMLDRTGKVAGKVAGAIPQPVRSAAGKVVNVPNALRAAETWGGSENK